MNLIYEHIPGIALTELLTGNIWLEQAAKLLLLNLLTVLEFIHQRNVIHRNINPDNIIQAGNKWILIDFATVKEMRHSDESISQSTLTQGMAGYMSAEQLIGISTYGSDIYAVGMIIVYCLTGIHPRKLKINRRTANVIWRDYAQVSDRFANLIDRAVCYDFKNRYQKVSEILNDLATT